MVSASNLEIRPLSAVEWCEIQFFLKEEWGEDHPLLDKELFYWQFQGFGPDSGLESSPTVWLDDRLIGMRALIPGIYQIPTRDGSYRLARGCSTSMWMVRDQYRGLGAGYRLWQATNELYDVRVSLGANESTAVPFYRRAGYRRIDALHHWFYPLDPTGFLALCYGSWRQSMIEIQVRQRLANERPPSYLGARVLADVWDMAVRDASVFGLYRTEQFWQWRYLDHPRFRYLTFGDPSAAGVVIARLEQVDPFGNPPVGPLAVLRLIELVPTGSAAWRGEQDERFASLLGGVLQWAKDAGCVAADFRCSSKRLGAMLDKLGFHFRANESPDERGTGFAGLLRPLRLSPRPINVHWQMKGRPFDSPLSDDDAYFVKSDNDMDRPNDPPSRPIA